MVSLRTKCGATIACIFVIWACVLMYGRYKCISAWTNFQQRLATDSPEMDDLLDESSIEVHREDLRKHYFLCKSEYDEGLVSKLRIPLLKFEYIEDMVRDRELAVLPQRLSDFLCGRVWLTHPTGAGYGGIQVSWGSIRFVHGG